MSIPESLAQYGPETQYEAALERVRWPDGFRCSRCGGHARCVLLGSSRKVFQGNACLHQASVIAGTVMQGTKLPLVTWILAILLLSQAKTGLSALALQRQLGVCYRTAWALQHKLMLAMTAREKRYVLSGTVQLDDAYLGCERPRGKAGRSRRTRFRSWRLYLSTTRGIPCG